MALPLYNIRFILLISASFITIFSSIAIYFCLPILISHVIRSQLALSPTSGSYHDWRYNSVVDRIFLYNITNIDVLLNDPVRNSRQPRPVPEIKEVGPFTFRQDREKLNIAFDTKNETVIYDQKKKWTFMPELSVAKSIQELNTTMIHHMSIPLAGTTLNAEFAELIDPTIVEFDLKLFLNNSVNTLLFDGYKDVLMEQAKSVGQIDVDKFGWMHNQNNSIIPKIRVFTGVTNATMDKFGTVDQFNQKKYFGVWHNNGSDPKDPSNVQCNQFRLSSAGEFFPPPEYSLISHNNNNQQNFDNQPDLRKQIGTVKLSPAQSLLIDLESLSSVGELKSKEKSGKTISLFMPDLCRTFKLVYNRTHNFRNLIVDRYIANEFTYDYTETESDDITSSPKELINERIAVSGRHSNKCYCTYNETSKLSSCPPNGMMDLFMCRKGSPLTISFPHFLYSDRDKSLEPYLKMFNDETKPNESDHQFFIDLESTLNLPVKAQIVIQFNVHFKNEQALNFTREYAYLFDNPEGSGKLPSDLYLPQMWIKSSAEIDANNLKRLIFIQHHLKLVTPITAVTIFIFASILLMMSAKMAYDLTYGPKSRKSMSRDRGSCSSSDQHDLEDKYKHCALQPLSGDCKQNSHNHDDHRRLDKATTSKLDYLAGEQQPLNS